MRTIPLNIGRIDLFVNSSVAAISPSLRAATFLIYTYIYLVSNWLITVETADADAREISGVGVVDTPAAVQARTGSTKAQARMQRPSRLFLSNRLRFI